MQRILFELIVNRVRIIVFRLRVRREAIQFLIRMDSLKTISQM
jgi:hypothetical protein